MRQPSLMAATAALSVTALFFSLGGAGWAANGGAFILGVFNSATQKTALVANFNGSALQVSNTSATASAVPLQLTAAAGHPPMKINTAVKVTNLNADYVDSIDAATQLTRVMRIPFTLAPGAITASIVLPDNLPVHVMGTDGGSCASEATIVRNGTTVGWVGAESCFDSSQPSGYGSSVAGDPILILANSPIGGGGRALEVEVAAGGAIRVRNVTGSFNYGGEITLVW